MNELVTLMRNDAVVSSLQIANDFGKRHDRVMQTIDEQYGHLHGFVDMFRKATVPDSYGRKQKIYYMNRDGFSLLVMGFTGKKALDWKMKYISAFNAMEKVIRERLTIEWQHTRAAGKLTRRAETDVIQQLAEYAKCQGSKNSQMLYMVYSRLANKAVGVTSRETASIRELNRLEEVEEMILKIIRRDMANGLHYKEIYQNCKRQLELWQEVLMVA